MSTHTTLCYHCNTQEANAECVRCKRAYFCSAACQTEAFRLNQGCCKATSTSRPPLHIENNHALPVVQRPGLAETFGRTDGNLERLTRENTNYRRVISTTRDAQVVLMALLPGEHIGLETHMDGTQFVRIEAGEGERILTKNAQPKRLVRDGDFFVVAPGVEHDLWNTSYGELLRLYVIYMPPRHDPKLIQITRPTGE